LHSNLHRNYALLSTASQVFQSQSFFVIVWNRALSPGAIRDGEDSWRTRVVCAAAGGPQERQTSALPAVQPGHGVAGCLFLRPTSRSSVRWRPRSRAGPKPCRARWDKTDLVVLAVQHIRNPVSKWPLTSPTRQRGLV